MPTSMTTAPGLTMSAVSVLRPAGGGHHDVGLARVHGDVGRGAVADGDGGVGLQQQQRHRLAHGVAAADHHRVLALEVARRCSRSASCSRRAWPGRRPGRPVISAPALCTEKPSTSFSGAMAAMTFCGSMCLGTGICTRMPWMPGSALSAAMRASSSASGSVCGVLLHHRAQAVVLAGLDLVAHVDLRWPGPRRPGSRPGRAGGRAASARPARRPGRGSGC
jgi:hypothetical protein